MFWLRNKENNFQLRTFIWGPATCESPAVKRYFYVLHSITLCLGHVSSADNLYKQFGVFDTLMVSLKEYIKKKLILKKNQQTTKSIKNYPACRVNFYPIAELYFLAL